MYDREIVWEILQQIHDAARRVLWRFDPVNKVDDFTKSEEGM